MRQKTQKFVLITAAILLFSLGSYAHGRFSVSFWQDGELRHINARDNTVTLENREFDILFGFVDSPISISVNASFDAANFNAAKKGLPLGKLACFEPGTGMAEGLNNSDKSLTINSNGHNSWFYEDQEFNRFNIIKKEKTGGIAATRTISRLSDVVTRDFLEWSDVTKPLYLVFYSYGFLGNSSQQVELHRDYIKINWIQTTKKSEQSSESQSDEKQYQNPDYERIKQNIESGLSDFHYPKLWNRFQQGDSTMTLDARRHLYYGYVFHKNYSPFRSKYDEQKINAIIDKENPSAAELKTLVALLDDALTAQPFNCKALYIQAIAYYELNQMADYQKNRAKINCIFDALVSTGNGLEKETAVHIIDKYSAEDYLLLHNLSMAYMTLEKGGYDVWYLKPNDYDLKKLWFDVNKPYRAGGDAYYKMFFGE